MPACNSTSPSCRLLQVNQSGPTHSDGAMKSQQVTHMSGDSTAEGSTDQVDSQADQAARFSSNAHSTSSSSLHISHPAAQGSLVSTSEPIQASKEASEPDLAAAETLSPESALPSPEAGVASPARLQSPDQALPGLSAFQKRLHSMLPQLPTLEKLSQLSQEVCTNHIPLRHGFCQAYMVQHSARP